MFGIRTAVAAVTAVAALALPASALAQDPLEWQFTYGLDQPYGQQGLVPGKTYAFQDEHAPTDYQSLVYGNQTFGVDLDWTTGQITYYRDEGINWHPQWQFVRNPNHASTIGIPAAEQIALYNTANHMYLIRAITNFGVRLGWVDHPNYQWQIAEGEPTTGHQRTRDQLYNTVEQAYLVHADETFGVDLGWLHAPFGLPPGYLPPKSLIQRVGTPTATATTAKL